MTLISIPDDDLVLFRSLGKCITLQKRRGNLYAVKIYKPTKKRKASLDVFFGDIFDNQKTLWDSLSQSEKDYWKNKGQGYGMTGLELYIQEGWKSNLGAVYGVGKYKQSYYGSAID